MGFKHYKLQVLLRILLLCASVFILARLEFGIALRSTIIGLSLAIVLQVWLLMRYLHRSDKLFLRFLNAIKYDDFTEQFHLSNEGKTQRALAESLNGVMDKFRSIRAEKEANLQYFELIVHHIGIGIISFKPDGRILLMNHAAKKLLKVGRTNQVQELEPLSPQLVFGLMELHSGGRALVPVRVGSSNQANLSVHVVEMSLLGEQIRLASLQNIQSELEENEMEAWNKLIRVLTHEIMNSVTPIASLSASASEEISSYTDTDAEEITLLREELQDVGQCLQTISRRSDGLIKFVNEFRSLTTITMPHLSRFNVAELLQETKTLLREQLAAQHIILSIETPGENLLLEADRSMIAQVLINLIKNAMEAVSEQDDGRITLEAALDARSRVTIKVTDNGPGMTPEALSKIFIPFYTTKKQGSGIGLSLSRQIMRLHRGSVQATSELGKGTAFVLIF
ncbi:sensor histidine kinase [Pontibacter oryzae]|uniref:histidine kinase n=1 Tax=Pontibacter oryzae TaxID=2304593 RepID=A0A399SJ43_9BACT|nr:HAMP domain-containing sensor histidine kinase [Pontibacter oryzae]RIJ41907.1 sensor histidine kinase [Pontibacter oryzae]